MTPIDAIKGAAKILPANMFSDSQRAVVVMLAIQLQEAPNQEQCQVTSNKSTCGPARGIFQFESGGGVVGVLTHPLTRNHAAAVCKALGVPATRDGVYNELRTNNDVLDAAFARLLLWADPYRLPAYGDVEGAWQLYLRQWRPGAYTRGDVTKRRELRQKWGYNYAKAMETAKQW